MLYIGVDLTAAEKEWIHNWQLLEKHIPWARLVLAGDIYSHIARRLAGFWHLAPTRGGQTDKG